MGIIFLTSTGLSCNKVRKVFIEKIKPAAGKKAVIITTAADEKEQDKYCQLAIKQLKEIGLNYVDFVDLETEPYKDFSIYDIIYVSGGNTFRLLKFAIDCGFKQRIEELLKRGGVYIGVSAGSYILCPNIETAEWKIKAGIAPEKNRFGLKDLTGFNLVPFLLFVHFEPEYKKIIKKELKNAKYPLKVLTDNQALIVIGKSVKLIGE